MRIGIGAQLLSFPLVYKGGLGSYMRNLLRSLPDAVNGHHVEVFWGREGHGIARDLGILNNPRYHHRISHFPLNGRLNRWAWDQLALPIIARMPGLEVFHFMDQLVTFVPVAPRRV